MYICINKYESCTHPKMIKLTLFFRTSYSLEAPKKAHTKEKKKSLRLSFNSLVSHHNTNSKRHLVKNFSEFLRASKIFTSSIYL